jgi:hypothetical protein
VSHHEYVVFLSTHGDLIMAKKMKGFLKFTLKGNEEANFEVHGDGLEDSDDVTVISRLRDENGSPTGKSVVWESPTARKLANGKRLKISSKKLVTDPSLRDDKSGDLIGDLIGDLTVTVQYPNSDPLSLSMSSVVYEP